ncbi:DUF4129 domain-containing protein [Paenibacillus sp. HJL G12]|uniref:DUF4129 domain-containing protein n=1 Tax=Paenibacillus dendrobii TaxID=2691084 RepID=A0A7X3IMV8_9BACL|nr:DUF4129 domain-containing protein [Paenibacillus dendrobii]MWV46376.1 DUF4129 domain-containing protein [Paenibacillus dendrobii]
MMHSGQETRRRKLLAVLGNSLLETAACYPFVVLYMVYAMQSAPWWLMPLIWLLHALGTLIGRRQAAGRKELLVTALLLVAALLPLAVLGLRPAILAVVVLLLADFRGLIVGRKDLWRFIQLNLPLAGLAAALIVYGVSSNVEAIEPYRVPLYFMSIFTLFAVLLRWNGDRVREASNAHETDRMQLRRILSRNRWMTWLVVAFIAVLSLWNGLGEGLAYFKRWLTGLLNGLGKSGQAESPEQMPPAQPGPMELPPPSHQPKWLHIVGQIAFAVLVAAVAAALLLLLYRLLRRWLPQSIRAWIARMAQRLRLMREMRRIPTDQGDYVDEVERIERVNKGQGRWRRKRKEGPTLARDGDPRRAYESLIRMAVRRGFKFRPSLTPSENGAALASDKDLTGLPAQDMDQVISRYNQARYGSNDKR